MASRSRSRKASRKNLQKKNDDSDIVAIEEICPARNDMISRTQTNDVELQKMQRQDILCSMIPSRSKNIHYVPLTCFGEPLCREPTPITNMPSNTDICCWYCTYPFDTIPIPIPVEYDHRIERFIIQGVACSGQCAWAYLEQETRQDEELLQERILMLRILLIKYGLSLDNFNCPALNRYVLKKFNPHYGITIEEYRRENIVLTKDPVYSPLYTMFPMIVELNASTLRQDTRETRDVLADIQTASEDILNQNNDELQITMSLAEADMRECNPTGLRLDREPVLASSLDFSAQLNMSPVTFFDQQEEEISNETNRTKKQIRTMTLQSDREKNYGTSLFDEFLQCDDLDAEKKKIEAFERLKKKKNK
jgi:hypothetical protein